MPKTPAVAYDQKALQTLAKEFRRVSDLLDAAAADYKSSGLKKPIFLEGQKAIQEGLTAAEKMRHQARFKIEVAKVEAKKSGK